MTDLEKTMYEALRNGMSQEEILRVIVDTKKKIAEEKTRTDEIKLARGEFIDALVEYLKVLGIEEFFERIAEFDEEQDVEDMIDNFWEEMYSSLEQKEQIITKLFQIKANDLDAFEKHAKSIINFF